MSIQEKVVVSDAPPIVLDGGKPVVTGETTVIDLTDSMIGATGVGATTEIVSVPEEVDLGKDLEVAEAIRAAALRYRDEALTGADMSSVGDELLPASDGPVRLLFERRYVKDAPRFQDQLEDITRDEPFSYTRPNGRAGSMTEHEGLVQLDKLFGAVAEAAADMPLSVRKHSRESLLHLVETQVPSMRDELTFIGSREYQEGIMGLGEYWKTLLRDNPDMQLCVVTNVGEFSRYKAANQRKSDDKLREDILLTFTPEELEELGPRIIGNLEDISTPADKVKVIILDDWSISGDQMRDSYQRLIQTDPKLVSELEAWGNLEINLLTAGEERIRNGFIIDEFRPEDGAVPVVAYYRSHNAPKSKVRTSGHVSGLHSSVNWDFAKTIEGLLNFAKSMQLDVPSVIALGNIVRKYKSLPRALEFTANGVKPASTMQEQKA